MIFLVLFANLPYMMVVSAQDLDQQYNDFVSTIPETLITNKSSEVSVLNHVRIIYLIPADSIEKPEYTIALENAARHLQIWYYNELGQNKTFALQDPVVEVYQTPHEALWYSTNPNGTPFYWFWNNVLQDGFLLTGGMRNDLDNLWVFYMDANPGCDQCGGCGGNGLAVISANDLKGLVGDEIDKSCPNVIHSYEPCRYVGGLGHELGHALGLPHPQECDEEFPYCWDHDLMMYGYIKYPDAVLNEADQLRLSNLRFIRDIDIEGLWYPSSCMDLNDTCNFSYISQISIPCGDSILLKGQYQNTSGIYYDTINFAAGCDSIMVTYLTVSPPPPEVEVEYVSICEGEPVPDLIAIGENIQWYDDADLSNLIYSGDTLKIGKPVPGTYQYYVTQAISDCTSPSVMVTLDIHRISQSPNVNDTACCEGEYLEYLYAESYYDYIRWYSEPELTNPLTYSERLDISHITKPGIYVFYVTSTLNCESLPDTVTFTINPLPQLPLADDVSICENESLALLAANGENITWYRESGRNIFDVRDHQKYLGVEIGNQVWMAENLNYYTPFRSWYYNDDSISFSKLYGRLYDNEVAHGVCPSGWHLPSLSEWNEMIDFLGGDSVAGGKLKAADTAFWVPPNLGATNESGFTALPGGYIIFDNFFNLGEEAIFWTSTGAGKEMGLAFKLSSYSPEITAKKLYYQDEGASIRCIKDSIHDNFDIIEFGDTLVVSNIQTGIFPFYATQTISNCISPLDTVTLTINPIPEAPQVNDITACEGEEIPDLLAIGENIRWYADAGLSSLVNSGSNYPSGQTQAGVYTYFPTQTVLNCQSPADSVYLNIQSSPSVYLGNDTTIFINQDIVLDLGIPDYLFSWSDGSDLSSCKISGSELGPGEHIYWVVVTDTNSCSTSDSIVITVIDPSSLNFANAGNIIRIYPNPTNDLLTIEPGSIDIHSIEITSLNGQLIYSTSLGGTIHQIDLSSFQNGIYFITIRSKDFVTTQKIIKL